MENRIKKRATFGQYDIDRYYSQSAQFRQFFAPQFSKIDEFFIYKYLFFIRNPPKVVLEVQLGLAHIANRPTLVCSSWKCKYFVKKRRTD